MSLSQEPFWATVQCALDEGRDPLAEEAVLQRLERDPSLWPKLNRLLASLEELLGEEPIAPLPEGDESLHRLGPALAAGLAAVLSLPLLFAPSETVIVGDPARILSLELAVRTSDGTSRVRWHPDESIQIERQLESSPKPQEAVPTRGKVFVSVTRRNSP